MESQKALASGILEKIGEATSTLTYKIISENGETKKKVKEGKIEDHGEGLNQIVELLVDEKFGVIQDRSEITAVGHRVVHGGETFQAPTIIDEKVIDAIKENIALAPLHNPHNLTGINVAKSIFSNSLHVAVFDTAFHQTIPKKAFLYAIPYELYEKHRVRRYGFHGTSHSYVAEKCSEYLGKNLNELDLITIHLGNGASMAALKRGKCVDTSMGMTPLEGLVMGTRSGDIDPAIPFYLADHLKMSFSEINTLLNKDSGLKGICKTNDMREVIEKRNRGDKLANVAFEAYSYRIKKYIGAYFAVLERVDCIIFTGGIGENASDIRHLSCQGLKKLGIEIDQNKNNETCTGIMEINSSNSEVRVLVVPTNEELKIAQETKKIIEKLR